MFVHVGIFHVFCYANQSGLRVKWRLSMVKLCKYLNVFRRYWATFLWILLGILLWPLPLPIPLAPPLPHPLPTACRLHSAISAQVPARLGTPADTRVTHPIIVWKQTERHPGQCQLLIQHEGRERETKRKEEKKKSLYIFSIFSLFRLLSLSLV